MTHDLVRDFGGPRPRIVCLCGSTRFPEAFRQQNLKLTREGRIVLSIGCDTRNEADVTGVEDIDALKRRLVDLHRRKIDLADEVLVLNVYGYIGNSTRSEIAYAEKIGRPVRYLEPVEVARHDLVVAPLTDKLGSGDHRGTPDPTEAREAVTVERQRATEAADTITAGYAQDGQPLTGPQQALVQDMCVRAVPYVGLWARAVKGLFG